MTLPGWWVPPSPVEEPDPAVEMLRERYMRALGQHGVAVERQARALAWAADRELSAVERDHLVVMTQAREYEVALWAQLLGQLEAQLRALGADVPL